MSLPEGQERKYAYFPVQSKTSPGSGWGTAQHLLWLRPPESRDSCWTSPRIIRRRRRHCTPVKVHFQECNIPETALIRAIEKSRKELKFQHKICKTHQLLISHSNSHVFTKFNSNNPWNGPQIFNEYIHRIPLMYRRNIQTTNKIVEQLNIRHIPKHQSKFFQELCTIIHQFVPSENKTTNSYW